jgi:hypothetical protein
MPKYEQMIGRHERDRLILELHGRGYSDAEVAKRIPGGMSRRGVTHVLARLGAPGRHETPADDWEQEWYAPPGCPGGCR